VADFDDPTMVDDTIRSARMAVVRRCAIKIAVLPSSNTSSAASTFTSDFKSRFDVPRLRRALVSSEECPCQREQLALTRGK